MKKTLALLGLVASLALVSGRLNANCGHCEKGHEKKTAAGCADCKNGHGKKAEVGKAFCGDCPTHMEGVEVLLTNTAEGVTLTIITKDPSKVKELQEKAAKHFAKKEKGKMWVCPMGCANSDKPGKCPKCKMDLTEKK
ncbi:MAG TPA: hypothetical protein DCZ01_09885 [Elusimicrobia bacterium]|nr:MAG: hypothetical protein A2X37_02890 [Elusimicrobia bacterium GWA2_66_18]OGR70162.1 MAG: hypothetical protein A2X40_05340 [Elusimicrobia bacterium GWC2_65_9]HAZ08809.1 hypothetical protein [Elusimicrobiota bacterium]